MITRRTIVTMALGLVVLFGTFGLGWQLTLATWLTDKSSPYVGA